MAKKLQEAEETIERLQGAESATARPEVRSLGAENVVTHPAQFTTNILPTDVQMAPRHEMRPPPIEVPLETYQTHQSHQDIENSAGSAPAITGTPQESIARDISVDEHGKICYYGPTSAVHEPLGLASPSTNSLGRGDSSRRGNVRAYLVSRARESTIWEDFALGNAALQLGLPRQVIAKLLHLHWTWVAPMFMWVYRPAFMRT
jgi:hypothetical protein